VRRHLVLLVLPVIARLAAVAPATTAPPATPLDDGAIAPDASSCRGARRRPTASVA